MRGICFICGAARSGTTMLTNLLDGHPEIFMLPRETHILQYWNYHNSNDSTERFFTRDYFNTSDVLLLSDERVRGEQGKYMYEKYGVEETFRDKRIEKEDFMAEYLKTLERSGLSLEGIYMAVFNAVGLMIDENIENRVIIEKRPFDNELSAVLLSRKFSNVRFVHIIRDPRTRYLSAKMRRVYRKLGIFPAWANRLNGKDFATAHSEITMTSMELARLNKDILKDKYHIVLYEELLKDPRKEMEKIAKHLGIEFDECFLRQTSYGNEVRGISSVERKMPSGIKDTSEERVRQFYEETSRLERLILYLFTWEIGSYFNYDIERVGKLFIKDLALPLKNENPRDYVKNRKYMLHNLRDSSWMVTNRHFHDIVDNFDKGIATQD